MYKEQDLSEDVSFGLQWSETVFDDESSQLPLIDNPADPNQI